MGMTLGKDLQDISSRHPSVTSVSGDGLMWHIRLRGDPRHAEAAWEGDGQSMPMTTLVHDAAIKEGVFIGVLGGSTCGSHRPS